MLRTIDRYLVRQILPPFFLSLLVFTFLLEMPPIAQMADKLLAKGVPVGTVGTLLLTLLPQALAITVPAAFLLGLLVAFGRLSADSEWIALQACGVSLLRLLRPVAVLALVVWAATSWMMTVALPWGNQTFREITYGILSSRTETEIKPRVFFGELPQVMLYVREVRPGSQGWEDVFVAQTGSPGQPTVHLARRGRLAIDRGRKVVDIVLEDGSSHVVTEEADRGQQYKVNRFSSFVIRLDPGAIFPVGGPMKGDNEMTIAELNAQIEALRRQGQSPHNFVMALHNKFSIPAACLVFALIGMSIGFSSARSGKMGSFVVGMAVIFVYWIVMYLGRAAAKGGQMSASLAPWLPDLVLGAVGAALFVRRNRSAEGPLQVLMPSVAWLSRLFRRSGPSRSVAEESRRPRVVVVIRLPRLGLAWPRVLDRYVARSFGRLFLLSFASLMGIFYISTFIELAEKLFKEKATLATLLAYLWFRSPQFIYFVIPLAMLIAALVTVGLLTRNSELVVMKACGVSLYRAAAPLVLCAVVAGGALFYVQERLLAPRNRKADTLEKLIRTGEASTFDSANRRWLMARDGSIFNFAYFDSQRRRLSGLTLFEFAPDAWRLRRRVYVTAADYLPPQRRQGGLDGRTWTSAGGWVREFQPNGDAGAYVRVARGPLALESPEYFGTEPPDAEQMSYSELRAYIAELKQSGLDIVPLTVDLQRKLSFPFVTLVMTLIAVPFAAATGRRGALYGIGAGIALAMIYWITGNVFGAVGKAGLVAPMLAAWAPNLLFGAGAAYLLLTVRT